MVPKLTRHRGKDVVEWEDSNGKRHRERVKDEEAGEKRIQQILSTGKKAVTNATVKEYGEWWLKNVAKPNVAHSTYQEYEAVLRNHIYPEMGSKPFAKVTKPMIRELIAKKREDGYEPPTVRNMLAPLRGMYNQAIEDGEPIALNPAARFGKKNKGGQKTKINPYTKEETSGFLKKVLEVEPKDYPLYLCAFRSGIRQGELIALDGGDVDFENRLIHVQRTLSRGKIKSPKNGKDRFVDASAQLCAVLRELKPKRGEVLFPSEAGTMRDPSNLRKSFTAFITDNELRRIRFHDIRHTFATLQIKNNRSLAYIRDQLGHSSIKVTVDLYGHIRPGDFAGSADLLDDGTPDGTAGDESEAN